MIMTWILMVIIIFTTMQNEGTSSEVTVKVD